MGKRNKDRKKKEPFDWFVDDKGVQIICNYSKENNATCITSAIRNQLYKDSWSKLSEAEKEKYYIKCGPGTGIKRNHENCVVEVKQEEKNDIYTLKCKKQKIFEDIERRVENLGRSGYDEFVRECYYLVHINTRSFSDVKQYSCPGEISLSKFNLVSGILDNLHCIINTKPIPQGHSADAKDIADKTHKLPLKDEDFPSQTVTCAYELYQKILKFLFPHYNPDSPAILKREWPILYTYDSTSVLEMSLKSIINDAPQLKNHQKHEVKIYPIEKLLYELHKASFNLSRNSDKERRLNRESESIDIFVRDLYCEADNIACEYHEKTENREHCSKSKTIRWIYYICKYCCSLLNVKTKSEEHCPDNSSTISRSPSVKGFRSCAAKNTRNKYFTDHRHLDDDISNIKRPRIDNRNYRRSNYSSNTSRSSSPSTVTSTSNKSQVDYVIFDLVEEPSHKNNSIGGNKRRYQNSSTLSSISASSDLSQGSLDDNLNNNQSNNYAASSSHFQNARMSPSNCQYMSPRTNTSNFYVSCAPPANSPSRFEPPPCISQQTLPDYNLLSSANDPYSSYPEYRPILNLNHSYLPPSDVDSSHIYVPPQQQQTGYQLPNNTVSENVQNTIHEIRQPDHRNSNVFQQTEGLPIKRENQHDDDSQETADNVTNIKKESDCNNEDSSVQIDPSRIKPKSVDADFVVDNANVKQEPEDAEFVPVINVKDEPEENFIEFAASEDLRNIVQSMGENLARDFGDSDTNTEIFPTRSSPLVCPPAPIISSDPMYMSTINT